MTRPNPLLQPFDLFPYASVQVEDLQPAIQQIVEDSRSALALIIEREADQLRSFAREQGCDDLQPWDYEFYAQKMRQHEGRDPDQALREYFSFETALSGLIGLVEQLYGISIKKVAAEVWDTQVQVLQITEAGDVLGHIYLDAFVRPGSRPGRGHLPFAIDMLMPMVLCRDLLRSCSVTSNQAGCR